MTKQDSKVKSFPKGFFTNISACKKSVSKKPREDEKPFEWSESILNGQTKAKIVALRK